MPTACPRCRRANPPDAQFCFADGASLGGPGQHRAMVDPARQRFPRPFVFPSGAACHSFDEPVLACFNDWKSACELLRENSLTAFLAGLGRADLARLAREASRQPDADHALDGLIQRLPSSVLQPPKVHADPAQVNLGEMRPGRDVPITLQLQNVGLGLLVGSADCSGTPWLFLGRPGAASKKKVFQFLHDGTVPAFINGRALQAAKKPLEGGIVLETNGGRVTVPVTLSVPILPFPDGALAGSTTPRQVADKALAQPHEAGEAFAGGAVARWYASNGWSYPVREPAATGVSAVQQFFEALGLSKPPNVSLDRTELVLEAWAGEPASGTVSLAGDTKQPIWASVECQTPWLDVREVIHDKKSATIRLGTSHAPDQPGESVVARVIVTTNGRAKHVVNVRVNVRGRRREAIEVPPVRAPAPVPAPAPATLRLPPMPAPQQPPPRRRETAGEESERAPEGGRSFAALLPVVLVLLGLGTTLACDLVSWLRAKPAGALPGAEEFKGKEQAVFLSFHDQEREVVLAVGGSAKPGEEAPKEAKPAFWEPSMRFGLSMDTSRSDQGRRLTYMTRGLTNNCVIRLDGNEWIFGERPFRDKASGQFLGAWPGRWAEREAKLDQPLMEGRKSVWEYETQKVFIVQTIGLMIGEQTGRIDTCLVHYRIENRDNAPHRVGLRFLLDTFIGQNDGVPFLIPGKKQMCSTMEAFNTPRDVPDFIQACEREDLDNTGTVAQVRLRLAGVEPPSRVTLGAWPNPKLRLPAARQEKTLWEVPLLSLKTLNDSAVTMYWDERPIEAGGAREMAFSYGLGSVSSGGTGGALALSVGGSFTPRGEFTLTASVREPAGGQSLRLELPEGFERIAGEETERVPPLPGDGSTRISPVTWRIRAGGSAGEFPLTVSSSTGGKVTRKVLIKVRGIFGN